MAKSAKFSSVSTRFARFCGLGTVVLVLVGCETAPKKVPNLVTKSDTELAIEALSEEWLRECEGLSGEPDDSVGALLQDGTTAMSLLGQCVARHNGLVRYLRPIVAAEKLPR